MSKGIIISLVLIIGLSIGGFVPYATEKWYEITQAKIAEGSSTPEAITAAKVLSEESYHFGLENGILSVIEGMPGANGKVIVTGLDVNNWPKEILGIATQVEFYSLDEVQSFIDSVNEPLMIE